MADLFRYEDEDEDFQSLLMKHLISRECNGRERSRSTSPQAEQQRALSRRQQQQLRKLHVRRARGLVDDAPPNPQPGLQELLGGFPAVQSHKKNARLEGEQVSPKKPAERPRSSTTAAADGQGARASASGEPSDWRPADGSSKPWLGLSDLASSGKGVPGSRQHLVSLAASVALTAAELRAQMPPPKPAAIAASGEQRRQLVGFRVRKTPSKVRAPIEVGSPADEDEDDGGGGAGLRALNAVSRAPPLHATTTKAPIEAPPDMTAARLARAAAEAAAARVEAAAKATAMQGLDAHKKRSQVETIPLTNPPMGGRPEETNSPTCRAGSTAAGAAQPLIMPPTAPPPAPPPAPPSAPPAATPAAPPVANLKREMELRALALQRLQRRPL
jgi:hypothetical protein